MSVWFWLVECLGVLHHDNVALRVNGKKCGSQASPNQHSMTMSNLGRVAVTGFCILGFLAHSGACVFGAGKWASLWWENSLGDQKMGSFFGHPNFVFFCFFKASTVFFWGVEGHGFVLVGHAFANIN